MVSDVTGEQPADDVENACGQLDALPDHAHTHTHLYRQAHSHHHSHATHTASAADAAALDAQVLATHYAFPNHRSEHSSCNQASTAHGLLTQHYFTHSRKRWWWVLLLVAAIILVGVFAMRFGAYPIALGEWVQVLLGQGEATTSVAIWRIRMPRMVGALVCGWALALSGMSIQTLLKNPLASPSTIGISQGAAFGAAAAIVLLQAEMYVVTLLAFAGAFSASLVILLLSSLRKLSSEAVVLSGVALSSLFTSGTILLQFVADDTELAMVVFWTFGDIARASWGEIGFMLIIAAAASGFIYAKRWDLNAMVSGEEAAEGLGVNVRRTRSTGVVAVALVAAVSTAFFGVIAFVGLIAPHIARRIVGADHRFSIPFSALVGALLLLTSDTIGRVIIGSGSLPVGVVTSCLGAPMFLYLLMRRYQ